MDEAATVVQDGGGSWADTLDADTKTWVGGMGLDKLPEREALAKVLPMYRGAEQKLGVPADQVLRLPGKDAKPEDYMAIYRKLGAPEKAEDYGLQAPEGDSGEFLKAATTKFYELGVTKAQASGIAEWHNAQIEASKAASEEKWLASVAADINELKGMWLGDTYNTNVATAKQAFTAAGMPDEDIVAIEKALGIKKASQYFEILGRPYKEHKFAGTGQAQTFGGMSPEAAKGRIEALAKDVAWQDERRKGNADKQAEWTRLHEQAYGTAPANQEAA